jgi:hypothetical protein
VAKHIVASSLNSQVGGRGRQLRLLLHLYRAAAHGKLVAHRIADTEKFAQAAKTLKPSVAENAKRSWMALRQCGGNSHDASL